MKMFSCYHVAKQGLLLAIMDAESCWNKLSFWERGSNKGGYTLWIDSGFGFYFAFWLFQDDLVSKVAGGCMETWTEKTVLF